MKRSLFSIGLILLITLPLFSFGCAGRGASEYDKGLIRYNDEWITRAEYAQRTGGADYISPQTQPATSQPSSPPKTSAKPVTFQPIVLTGSASKTTPPFTVTTKEWIIEWSYTPNPEYPEMALFGFFVYPRGETVFFVESVMASIGGETSGSTYSYAGAGEYYIAVTVANVESWQITIKPAP